MKSNTVWIVEMKLGDRWLPTAGCALDRGYAQTIKAAFKHFNPDDRFRLRRYVAQKEGK